MQFSKIAPQIRRTQLITLLRNYQESLPGFKWDFSVVREEFECGTRGCAMGIASLLWPEVISGTEQFGRRTTSFVVNSEKIAELFGMTYEQVRKIFFNDNRSEEFYNPNNGPVTPAMVADALESL
jgi:hypothetical protein